MPDGERTACGSATRRHQADGAQDCAVVIKRRIPPFPWHLSQAHLSARTGDGTAQRMDKSVVAADYVERRTRLTPFPDSVRSVAIKEEII